MLRNLFPQFTDPTIDDLNELLANAIIVLDSSALLNLYRYSSATRTDFFKLYEHRSIKPRLWMPYQVAKEFMDNRLIVLTEKQNDAATLREDIREAFKTALKQAKKKTEQVARYNTEHPHINISRFQQGFERLEAKLEKDLNKFLESYLQSPSDLKTSANLDDDRTYKRIEKLFSDRVGTNYSQEELAKIREEGADRYRREIPPGYKDAPKKHLDPYGDLVIWKQLIDIAKTERKGIVFVSDDSKEDWIGKSGGPRKELIKEMFDEARQKVHIYNCREFLKFGKSLIKEKPRPESLQEAEDVNERLAELDHLFMTEQRQLLGLARRRYLEQIGREGPSLKAFKGLADMAESPIYNPVMSSSELNSILGASIGSAAINQTLLNNLGVSTGVKDTLLGAAYQDILAGNKDLLGSSAIDSVTSEYFKGMNALKNFRNQFAEAQVAAAAILPEHRIALGLSNSDEDVEEPEPNEDEDL